MRKQQIYIIHQHNYYKTVTYALITTENMNPTLNHNAYEKMLQNKLKQKQNYDKNALDK